MVAWYDAMSDWDRVKYGLAAMLFMVACGGYLLGLSSTLLLRRVEAQEANLAAQALPTRAQETAGAGAPSTTVPTSTRTATALTVAQGTSTSTATIAYVAPTAVAAPDVEQVHVVPRAIVAPPPPQPVSAITAPNATPTRQRAVESAPLSRVTATPGGSIPVAPTLSTLMPSPTRRPTNTPRAEAGTPGAPRAATPTIGLPAVPLGSTPTLAATTATPEATATPAAPEATALPSGPTPAPTLPVVTVPTAAPTAAAAESTPAPTVSSLPMAPLAPTAAAKPTSSVSQNGAAAPAPAGQ